MAVWAFSKVDNPKDRNLVYESILLGRSRFGWSQKDEHNLLLENTWTKWHSKQMFLLQIKPGDWIVHINTPKWGQCIAVQVTGAYDFDEGLKCTDGIDFRHAFPVNPKTICEFSRRSDNVSPAVNLRPRGRYHRIYEEKEFFKSLKNVKRNRVQLNEDSKGEFYLKEDTEYLLKQITSSIHKMNKSKNLESFLAKVFRKVEGVIEVKENGSGWGTDFGADLIVTFKNLNFINTVVVQVKSFDGYHHSLEAVHQTKDAIDKYEATAGIIITTANSTEKLEVAVEHLGETVGKPIELIAGEDVAKFVLKYAPEMVFKV
tara:strand:- start:939 stop:1886 length:948 start_codon:yes stop_codon:yes gene_type:complete